MPPTSVSSTTCSNPQNDTLEKVIENDKVRYVRKGYGLITASVIVLTYFLIIPRVAKTIWPEIIKNYEPN
jgi:sterol desaturase/sphingolipid hydroxylase (fatty acid hydroxylase superfamily)